MRKRLRQLRKRLLLLPASTLLAAVAVFALAAAALAVTLLFIILADMTIIPGPQEAEVYADPECTIPFPTLHWGDVQHGQDLQVDFYVKNTGVEPITANLSIQEDMSAIWTYTFTPQTFPLNPGDVEHVVFEAYILPTAPLGYVEYHYQGDTP